MDKRSKLSFSDAMFSSAFIHNPVLVQMVGLGAIVAVATTLKTALLLSLVFFPVMIITQAIANLLLKKVARWIRVVLYLVIGTAIVAPVMFLIDRIDPNLRIGAGIYLGLTAVSSITALHCEKFAVKTDFKSALFDAVACSVGYAAVIVVVGFFRELLGMASVWGKPVSVPFTFPALLMPFGGFIVLAFCAAALKALINKRFPEYSEETEIEIKKTSVIVSKKNLPEEDSAVEEQPEEERTEDTESEPEAEEAVETQVEESEKEETKEPEVEEAELEDLTPMEFEESEETHSQDIDEIIKAFEKREFPDLQNNSDDDDFGTTLSHLFGSVFDDTSAIEQEISEEGEGEK